MAPAGVHLSQLVVEALHLRSSQGAVDANSKGVGVLYADVECLDGLPGKRSATVVHNGGAQHHWQLLLLGLPEVFIYRVDGSLAILGVKDSLNHEQVHTAVHQAAHLLLVPWCAESLLKLELFQVMPYIPSNDESLN